MEIVDFFRNFTVDVVGVGDVCSFAQLDVRKRDKKTGEVNGILTFYSFYFFQNKKVVSFLYLFLNNFPFVIMNNCLLKKNFPYIKK